jgi:mono/diheme cytochrome c family protein
MKSVLIFSILAAAGILAGALYAREPNLPQQAPQQWSTKSNPLAGNPRAQKAGAKLYERECAACHGAGADGSRRTPSLRQAAVAQAPPGALYWILENGAIFHGMPSFAHLPERERWQIITFLQSLNTRPQPLPPTSDSRPPNWCRAACSSSILSGTSRENP